MKPKIDHDEITKLIDLLEIRNLHQLELEVEGFKIKISREQQSGTSAGKKLIKKTESDYIALGTAELAEPERSLSQDGLYVVTSPMVGTFYRSPDPSSPPFVEKGDQVKKNQTLCIIEAMKLMNEIETEVDGVLEEIFIKNGKPVEYGQKLFAIKILT
ncbi:MAG: acetyl-CoA carboxylase biotin carboxyl carrier protein [Candidatus Aminicenantes bacterium]|nr:acetyl-CoA carboxylase biotin carboxyl carrier protein [Candidatus Aminicenantes bacterium]